MPIYTFKCQKCLHESDKLVRDMGKRDEPIQCSKCGGETIRMTANRVSAHFRGRGWTPKRMERK